MRLSKIVLLVLALCVSCMLAAQDDESAYSAARRALNRQQFDVAIGGFRELRRTYPTSRLAGDSLYWEAFALERSGELVLAARTLETARSQYPNAATSAEARALRVQVCSELARRGDGECAADVSVVVRDSSQLDEATKLAAMNALINMRADRAVPIATQALENPNQPNEVRKRAIFILADKAEEANAEAQVRATLVRVAASSAEDRELREQAIFWLSEIPGDETLDALTQLMSGTLDGDLKTRAIFAISQHDSPRAMGLLREYAEDSRLDVELRKQAIFWLGQEGEEQAVPYLTDLYGKVDDAELKQQILFAVAETDAASALDWLLARATDPAESLETRKKALFHASQTGASVAGLRSVYAGATEPDLRQHLIWLISESDDPAALDALLEIARADPDPQMRSQAIFWLGQSDDPRAEGFLVELLSQ